MTPKDLAFMDFWARIRPGMRVVHERWGIGTIVQYGQARWWAVFGRLDLRRPACYLCRFDNGTTRIVYPADLKEAVRITILKPPAQSRISRRRL